MAANATPAAPREPRPPPSKSTPTTPFKRLLIHTSAFNLSLLMRQLTGIGKPKSLQNRDMEGLRRRLQPGAALLVDILSLWHRCPTGFLVFLTKAPVFAVSPPGETLAASP